METKLTNDIVSTIAEDKPLIYISEEAINLKSDNDKLKQRIDKAIEYIKAGKTFDNEDTSKAVEYLQNNLLDILAGENNEKE